MRHRHLGLALLLVPLYATAGCGGGDTVWVTGKVVKGGTRYAPPADQTVTITLVSLGEGPTGKAAPGGEPYQADYDPAGGTFTVPGPERSGIPPGKYRVAVTQKLQRAAYDAARERIKDKAKKNAFTRDADMLEDKFGLTSSPIIVEVTGAQELTVDLDTPPKTPPPAPTSKPKRGSDPEP